MMSTETLAMLTNMNIEVTSYYNSFWSGYWSIFFLAEWPGWGVYTQTKLIIDFPQRNCSIINLVLCLTTDITLSIHFPATGTPTPPPPESSPYQKNLHKFLAAIFEADSPLYLDFCMQQISISLLYNISTIVPTFRVAIQISVYLLTSESFTMTWHNGYHLQIL